jgi:uncharacterized lipoprotein YbaY
MITPKTATLLAMLSVSLCNAEPQAIKPTAMWKGSIDDVATKPTPTRLITQADEFTQLWRDWKVAGTLPQIDFVKSCIVVETTSGSVLSVSGQLNESGELKTFGMATRDMRPGFRYVIAQFDLKGVKSINGVAIAAPTLTGSVTCKTQDQIPEGASVTIRLLDVSLADASSKTLAEQIVKGPSNFPISYALSFDPSTLRLEHSQFYGLSARIEKDGKLLFINDTHIVISKDGKLLTDVELPVIKVP